MYAAEVIITRCVFLVSTHAQSLQPASTTSSLLPGRVAGDGGAVLDAADLHAGTSQGAEGGLSSGAGSLSAVAACSTQLDVEGGDSQNLDLLSHVLSGQHSGVGGSFVPVSLDLHASGDTGDGLATGQISHVNESVVEGSEDVGNTEHQLALANLRSQRNLDLLFDNLSLARSHSLLQSLVEVNQAIL